MGTLRPFYPRRQFHVGRVIVPVAVANVLDPTKELRFDAMVDTGAFGLVLPAAWKESLGPLSDVAIVEIEPLVGYTVLELAGAVVDMVTHRLVARKYFDVKVAAATVDERLALAP
jgi:predicted aspartyl protease